MKRLKQVALVHVHVTIHVACSKCTCTCLTSWKKADKRNTAACDVTLEYPLVISGV